MLRITKTQVARIPLTSEAVAPAERPLARPAPQRRPLRQWLVRWPALLATVVAVPIALACCASTLAWPGRTFPGFFVLRNAVVPTAGLYEWTGIQAGVPFLSRVTAVDGVPVRCAADVYSRVLRLTPGTPVRYTLERDGRVLERVVPAMRFGWQDWALTVGAMAVFGLVSVLAGIVVALLQPRTQAALAFLIFGVVTGLFGSSGGALYLPAGWPVLELQLLAQAFFPATFLHLGLVFPVVHPAVQRHRALLVVPYVIAGGLAVWTLGGFLHEPPWLGPIYADFVFSAVGIVGILALFARAWRENRTPDVRPQLRSVVPGFVAGSLVGLFAFVDHTLGNGRFPLNLVAVTPLLFFLSVAYAIVRHDLFDIDVLVRRFFVYALLTGGIGALYAAIVALAALLRPESTPAANPVVIVAFAALTALVFQPLRRLLQDTIDRVFARGRLDYRRTVSRLSGELTSLLDLDEIVRRVGHTLTDGLQLGSMRVLLWSDGTAECREFTDTGMHERATPPCAALRQRLEASPERSWAPPRPREGDDPASADAAVLDADLVVPLNLGGRVIGAFALARPRSGRAFSRDDVELLETLAAQTAIAVGNARSYQALERANAELEEKVEARTAALAQAYDQLQATQAQLVHQEKMASLGVLVAGVAHEMNNPVSFIVGGIDPLRDAVRTMRRFADAHPEADLERAVTRAGRAVEAIARGAVRTADVVRDLRTFSRQGDSRARAIDLHEGIDVTLRLLEPRLGDRITVVREYGTLPPVEVVPDEMNQVWMNLLANACDAIPGRGTIRISSEAAGDAVRVAVRDDGGGIAPDLLPRIFDPFFTTKGPGDGTGLGLSIAHGIVDRHGGRIDVRSAPGAGSTFTVVLPLRRPAPEHTARS